MIKYEIFIERENKQIEKFKKLEHMYIDKNINYDDIKGISNIARAGLNEVRPLSIGEATRISGVTSNDITLIIAHINDNKGLFMLKCNYKKLVKKNNNYTFLEES